ncbi:MAG: D-alanyl-D-alanine carboxypeptidase family protein [Dehalococcoidia bacterium]
MRAISPVPWALPPLRIDVAPPEVSAIAAVVLDEASGAVLYEKDGYRPLPPASTTKIATAILAIEHGGLDAEVVSDVDASLMARSSVMGLRLEDRFTLRDLLYGLMLPSGNDAALAIGRAVSGSDAAFVAEMNGLLDRMGLDTSHFANPHGLGARNHVVSARDLAVLARYAMTLPEYRDITCTYSYRAAGSRTINMVSANSFVFAYPGADSAKIGYTRSAGNTLVASATRNGHRLYAVVLNTSSRDADAARLLDWAFANHTWQ